ncbi:MAG: hypothetical protein IT350_01510 [Deltaproteobacteria bacterium]|nr:hypothetical protein [Deltaproteobacteria bacterium]
MNVPAATWVHRVRARMRLALGAEARTIEWRVVRPGEDGTPWGEVAPDAEPLREHAIHLAEDLAQAKPGLVVFSGHAPTRWHDLLDVVENFRIAGAAVWLVTGPHVFNPQSAPIIAYHFTRIRLVLPALPSEDELRRVRLLTGLWPRGPVDALLPANADDEVRRELRFAGVARVIEGTGVPRAGTIVHANLRVDRSR